MDSCRSKNSIELPIVDITPWLTDFDDDRGKDSTSPDSTPKFQGKIANEYHRLATVEKVKQACETVGFFVVSIPTSLKDKSAKIIKNASSSARMFFKEETQDKRLECAAKKGSSTSAYGYFPMLSESLGYAANVDKKPDIREAFSMGPVVPLSERLQRKLDEAKERLKINNCEADELLCNVMDFCYEPTPWPTSTLASTHGDSSCSSFKDSLSEFYSFASEIALITSKIMALALGFPENHFTEACSDGEHCNSARAIWYPQISKDYEVAETQMRCGEHSDTGLLTLLWCDGPGLEIKPVGSEEWISVDMKGLNESKAPDEKLGTTSIPTNYFIVNIGDLLAKVSGDKWKSTPHRVPVPEKTDVIRNQDRIVLVLFQILAADFPIQADLTQGEYLFSHFKRWGRNK